MREFDTETIYMIRVFEDVTGARVRDCIIDKTNGSVAFLVYPGQMGLAIGKKGANIKILEKLLKKEIKLFEYDHDLETFIKKLIPFSKRIEVKNKKVIVWVEPKFRGRVIGKNGGNIRLLRKIIERNCNGIEDIEVR